MHVIIMYVPFTPILVELYLQLYEQITIITMKFEQITIIYCNTFHVKKTLQNRFSPLYIAYI